MAPAIQNGNGCKDNIASLKSGYTQVIHDFLQDVSFQIPDRIYDHSLVGYVEDHLMSEGFSADFVEKAYPFICGGATAAVVFYPFTTIEVQRTVAIFTSYAIILEESAARIKADMRSFSHNLVTGRQQKTKILRCLTKWLRSAPGIFGPFAGSMMIKEAIEYTTAFVVEEDIAVPDKAPGFPQYFRLKTGGPESWAFFSFPENLYPEDKMLRVYLPSIPALVQFINYGNDLFSFYKEAIDGDYHNCVYTFARTHNMTTLQALHHYSMTVKKAVQEVRDILSREPQMKDHLDQFMQGYIFWHLAMPRYRLDELNILQVKKAKERLFSDRGERVISPLPGNE